MDGKRRYGKLILKLLAAALFVAAAAAAWFVYVTEYRAVPAAEYVSPDGAWRVSVYMIGEPDFPFGPVKCRMDLLNGGKKISSAEAEVKNDGAKAGEENFEVLFTDEGAYITVKGDEMDDIHIIMYYDSEVEEQP